MTICNNDIKLNSLVVL